MRSIVVTFRPKRSQTLPEWTGQLDAIIFVLNTNRPETRYECCITSIYRANLVTRTLTSCWIAYNIRAQPLDLLICSDNACAYIRQINTTPAYRLQDINIRLQIVHPKWYQLFSSALHHSGKFILCTL
jgi:hypothetical protein